jgi:hypothetical protein
MQLDSLVSNFAHQIIAAIQDLSVGALVGATEGKFPAAVPARLSTEEGKASPAAAVNPSFVASEHRPARRSEEEIAKQLDKVVLLVKTHKGGMRAREIRATFGLSPEELRRILKSGIARKRLTAKGAKRSTLYFAMPPEGG